MWLRTRMIMWKEFIQLARDPRLLTVVVLIPIIMLLLYGYAINLDVRHVRMTVYDQDRTPASRALLSAFTQSTYFDVVADITTYREAEELLDRTQARVVLVIPLHFEQHLADGRTTPVQILVDGADSSTASTTIGYIAPIVQQYSARVALQAIRRQGYAGEALQPVDNRTRYWYNPELRSTIFIIPGLIAVILMALAALLTSVTVARERERGTLEQLIVSPVRPVELMLGKLAPYAIIAFCDVLLILLVGAFVFKVPIIGSVGLILLTSGIFVVAALGIGLLISVNAPSQQVAQMGAVMATQLPTVLLSGFIFPISSMPAFIRAITNIIPGMHFIKILRGVMLKGNTAAEVWQPAVLLLLLGITLFAVSTARFKKKL